jgi:putative peptidoglycan lipid II flippase
VTPLRKGLYRWTGPAVILLIVGAKGLAFIREAVIAAQLGTSAASDHYYVAFAIPTILYNLGAVPYALWITARLASARTDVEARLYRSATLLVIAVGVAVAAVILAATTLLISVVAPGTLDGAEQASVITSTRIGALATPALAWQAIANARLFAEGRFTVAYAWVAAGGLVGLAVVGISVPAYGASGAIAGFVTGYWSAALGAAWSAARHRAGSSRPDSGAPLPLYGRQVVACAVVMQTFTQGMLLLAYVFGSRLPAGQLAATMFAGKVQVALYETLIVTAGVLVFPRIVRALRNNETERAWSIMTGALQWAVPTVTLLAVVLVVFRLDIVTVVYQRRVFDGGATTLVSTALLGLAPGLIGLTLVEIVHRGLVLRGRVSGYALILGTALLVNWVFCVAMIPRLGILAVTLGGSLAAVIAGLGLVADAARRIHAARKLLPLVALAARSATAAVVTFAVLKVAYAVVSEPQTWEWQFVRLAVGGVLATAVFAGVLTMLGHQWPGDIIARTDVEAGAV